MLDKANGRRLRIVGMIWLLLKVGVIKRKHKLYVVSVLCNELIHGED